MGESCQNFTIINYMQRKNGGVNIILILVLGQLLEIMSPWSIYTLKIIQLTLKLLRKLPQTVLSSSEWQNLWTKAFKWLPVSQGKYIVI